MRPASLIAVVLVLLLGTTAATADTASYRLTVDNTWSESTHPGNFPVDAHFSWLGGGTHDGSVSFWEEGVVASPGIKRMAETGYTDVLIDEVNLAIVAGDASGVLSWEHWFCPQGTTHPSCGPLVVEFEIEVSHPRVTLATMLGPSPDWFVGVSGLSLRENDQWLPTLVVDLRPYDAGTRSANVWQLFGPLTEPPDPVSPITAQSGQLVGPGSLGSFTFELISAPDTDGDGVADDLDNCPQFANPNQGSAVFGHTVIASDVETFSWSVQVDAAFVRGDLATVGALTTNDGGALAGAAELTDVSTPPSGAGFYYLLRPDGVCAAPSWQTSEGAEPARDVALP